MVAGEAQTDLNFGPQDREHLVVESIEFVGPIEDIGAKRRVGLEFDGWLGPVRDGSESGLGTDLVVGGGGGGRHDVLSDSRGPLGGGADSTAGHSSVDRVCQHGCDSPGFRQ